MFHKKNRLLITPKSLKCKILHYYIHLLHTYITYIFYEKSIKDCTAEITALQISAWHIVYKKFEKACIIFRYINMILKYPHHRFISPATNISNNKMETNMKISPARIGIVQLICLPLRLQRSAQVLSYS